MLKPNLKSKIDSDDVTISPVKIVAQLASVNEVDVFSIQSLYFETLTNTLSSLSLCFPQTHYTEVVQGAIFMEQNMSFWADFGPVGNTERNWAIKYSAISIQ